MVGFDAKNKDIINLLYLCHKCNLILREPVQLECGHRQCKTCTEFIDGNIVKCVECHEETQKTKVFLDLGFQNDMKVLVIICALCEWNGLFKDYSEHLQQVHPNPVCEYCEEKFHSTIQLDEHKQKQCPKMVGFCAQRNHGCLVSVCRAQMIEHYSSEIHQKAIINAITRVTTKPPNEQRERISRLDINIGQTIPNTTVTPINVNNSAQIQEVLEVISILARGIKVLNGDLQSLEINSSQLQTTIQHLPQNIETLKLKIEGQDAWLIGFQINQDILLQQITSLKQEIDDRKYASYDGTLLWKVTDFHKKMMDAQSERQRSVYSPPFYSSYNGYKMRARLYLNGDGNARRTHMSLAFVLMRGSHDGLLKFPFNYKVTFCLYDQTFHQQHVIHTLLPDTKSISFQRPRLEMNAAICIPNFFPLTMIQQENNPYVRDDSMFIKVMVDFGDMPQTLLPYALRLNPALPMHIQQIMIQQEAERRAHPQ